MSRLTDSDLELDLDSEDIEVIEETDYAIVIGPDGKLKSIFMPEGYVDEEIPENIQKIMAIFGVADATDVATTRTLH